MLDVATSAFSGRTYSVTPWVMAHRNIIRELRDLRGHSQDSLAATVGYSKKTIQRLETGRQQLTAKWAERLSEALDVSPSALIEGAMPEDDPASVANGNHAPTPPRRAGPAPAGRDEAAPTIPVLGTVHASLAAQTADAFELEGEVARIACPVPLRAWRRLYGLFVQGESMAPMFTTGDVVLVSRDNPRRPGDVVVIGERRDGAEVCWLKLFVGRDADGTIRTRQVDGTEIAHVGAHVTRFHRVFTYREVLGL